MSKLFYNTWAEVLYRSQSPEVMKVTVANWATQNWVDDAILSKSKRKMTSRKRSSWSSPSSILRSWKLEGRNGKPRRSSSWGDHSGSLKQPQTSLHQDFKAERVHWNTPFIHQMVRLQGHSRTVPLLTEGQLGKALLRVTWETRQH